LFDFLSIFDTITDMNEGDNVERFPEGSSSECDVEEGESSLIALKMEGRLQRIKKAVEEKWQGWELGRELPRLYALCGGLYLGQGSLYLVSAARCRGEISVVGSLLTGIGVVSTILSGVFERGRLRDLEKEEEKKLLELRLEMYAPGGDEDE